MPGFYRHIKDAIRINRERRPIYTAMAGRPVRRASNMLIFIEYICLPFALRFDRRGIRFNNAGIPIIQDDFVSMEMIGDPHDPPTYTNRAGQGDLRALSTELIDYGRCLIDSAKAMNFELAASDTRRALAGVTELEAKCEAHFAMVKHVLQSIGFAAVNAARFEEMSAGKTALLSRDLLVFQSRGVRRAAALDQRAQKIHALGVGFLVNDLPPIPFAPPQCDTNRLAMTLKK